MSMMCIGGEDIRSATATLSGHAARVSLTGIGKGADKSLAFPISYLQYNQKNISWMG
jgi:hypothetical protein